MFKTTKDFNKTWNYFMETSGRERQRLEIKRLWMAGEDSVPFPQNRDTRSFQWAAETFKEWEVFKKTVDVDAIDNKYAYKKEYVPREELKREEELNQLNLF
jgi:hypothetical protein